MDVWSVYYNHWARESNLFKKKSVSKKAWIKTIKILWCWFERVPIDCIPRLSFSYFQGEVLDHVELMSIRHVEDKREHTDEMMNFLKQIVDYLCVRHTPTEPIFNDDIWFYIHNDQIEKKADAPYYVVSRAEKRFCRHMNCSRHFLSSFHFSTSNLRSLDAILALS